MRGRPFLFWLDVAVKAALVGLLVLAVVRPDLPQFEGKAFTARGLVYPWSVLVVPVGWSIAQRRRRRRIPYPYAMDVLLVLPFLIDVAGNAADLYDTIDWWDDATHLVNWAILTAAFGQLLLRLPLERLTIGALCVGFGAVTAILWEFAEYITFIRNSPELETAYTDTLGDMALGLSGSIVAALVTAIALSPATRGRSGSGARPDG
ncbi:MAG: hypothetical protein ACRDNE_11805 [Gaiellaceae bacterium]